MWATTAIPWQGSATCVQVVLSRAGHGVVTAMVAARGAPAVGSVKVLVQRRAKAPAARVCVCVRATGACETRPR